MNMYYYFIILFGLGLFMAMYPIVMSNFTETFSVVSIFYFGIGSALMGAGIGLGVGHLTYREKGAKNVD